MRKYTIYMHKNKVNNKIYIGITCQKAEKRWSKGKGYAHNIIFCRAIDKYGWNNFEHIILFENLSEEEAKEKEVELIKEYNSDNRNFGYNITIGGESNHKYKTIEEFEKNNIEHRKKANKKWRDNNKEKQKEYREKNKEKIKKYKKKYYEEHKEEIREKARQYRMKKPEILREWRKKNKERLSEYDKKKSKEYREKNKEKVKAMQREWYLKNREKVLKKQKEKRMLNKKREGYDETF